MINASIEKVSEVKTHPNADRLDLVKVLGFQCVVEKGIYKGGERIIYIRPDSVLPTDYPWAEDYLKYSPKRVKAVKLRGEWSEGIIVPLERFPENILTACIDDREGGNDISDIIGVSHYEPPAPKGMKQDPSIKSRELPWGIPKTDEERWENLKDDQIPWGEPVDITLKVDGQSCSYAYNIDTDEFKILGRSCEFHEDSHNNYTAHVERYDIKNKLIKLCKEFNISLCLRGESYGHGIQSHEINPYSKGPKGWVMFSVYMIKEREYARKGHELYLPGVTEIIDLPRVAMIKNVLLTPELIMEHSNAISMDYPQIFPGTQFTFEGSVVQHSKGSFKIVNKYYDSKK